MTNPGKARTLALPTNPPPPPPPMPPRAAPRVVPDDARLRAIIEERFRNQGPGQLNALTRSTIALAVDDIMEYLGSKATE